MQKKYSKALLNAIGRRAIYTSSAGNADNTETKMFQITAVKVRAYDWASDQSDFSQGWTSSLTGSLDPEFYVFAISFPIVCFHWLHGRSESVSWSDEIAITNPVFLGGVPDEAGVSGWEY
jgi:hypothetical protein